MAAVIYQFYELPVKKVKLDNNGKEIENNLYTYECKYCAQKGLKFQGKIFLVFIFFFITIRHINLNNKVNQFQLEL